MFVSWWWCRWNWILEITNTVVRTALVDWLLITCDIRYFQALQNREAPHHCLGLFEMRYTRLAQTAPSGLNLHEICHWNLRAVNRSSSKDHHQSIYHSRARVRWVSIRFIIKLVDTCQLPLTKNKNIFILVTTQNLPEISNITGTCCSNEVEYTTRIVVFVLRKLSQTQLSNSTHPRGQSA